VQLAIEIEAESTWPEEFLSEARKHRSLLIDYQREYERIDDLVRDDVMARTFPPPNRHKPDYSALASRLEVVLMPHRLVGYHCTRLTPREIARIRAGGMRTLSARLVHEKIAECVSDGHLTPDQGDFLRRHEFQIAALSDRRGGRTGVTYFCANRSTLSLAGGVHNLFRYWGGEATRGSPAGHPDILREIAHIGTPCIVKCAIPFVDARSVCENYAERLLSQFVVAEVEHPSPSTVINFHTEVDLAGGNVLKVIAFADAEFEDLTGYSGWAESDNINPAGQRGLLESAEAIATPSSDIHAPLDISDAERAEIIERLEREI
jgi:hypothetical protein